MPMSERVSDKFRGTIQSMVDLEERNSDLSKLCDKLRDRVRAQDILIGALQLRVEEAMNDMASVRHDRDQAVRDRAVFEVLFSSIRAQMGAFELPAIAVSAIRRKSRRRPVLLISKQPTNPAGIQQVDIDTLRAAS